MRQLVRIIGGVGVAAVATLGGASSASAAFITQVGPSTISGNGMGSVNTILTLQSPGGSSTEAGEVAYNAATSSDLITGNALTGASQTHTVIEAALAAVFPGFDFSSSNLLLVLNLSEPGNESPASVVLTGLTVTFYDASGAVVDVATLFNPTTIVQEGSGVGQSGQGFLITDIDPDAVRVGLSASITGATGGPETFFLGNGGEAEVLAIPGPPSVLLVASAAVVFGAAGWVRLRGGRPHRPPAA